MQGLLGHDGIVFPGRLPIIEVLLHKLQSAREPVFFSQLPATFKHGFVQVETLEGKVLNTCINHLPRDDHLAIAVARSNADEPVDAIQRTAALDDQIMSEEFVRVRKTERLEQRAN